MALRNNIKMIPLRSFDVSECDNTWKPINPLGLEEDCFAINLENNSTEPVLISLDGITPNIYIDTGSILPLSFLCTPMNKTYHVEKKTIIYVKNYNNKGIGNIFLSGYYI